MRRTRQAIRARRRHCGAEVRTAAELDAHGRAHYPWRREHHDAEAAGVLRSVRSAARVRRGKPDLRHLRGRDPAGYRGDRIRAGVARALDMAVERNAYGRQLDSRVVQLTPEPAVGRRCGDGGGVHPRARSSRRLGDGAKVLASGIKAIPVLVDFGRHLSRRSIRSFQMMTACTGCFWTAWATASRPVAWGATMEIVRRYRVLFVCIGNACRSQMAEAFAQEIRRRT